MIWCEESDSFIAMENGGAGMGRSLRGGKSFEKYFGNKLIYSKKFGWLWKYIYVLWIHLYLHWIRNLYITIFLV